MAAVFLFAPCFEYREIPVNILVDFQKQTKKGFKLPPTNFSTISP